MNLEKAQPANNNLLAGDLRIEWQDGTDGASAGPIRLLWQGRSNDRRPSRILDPYFDTVLSAARARGVPVELHFEEVEHFNSATITSIIQVIQDARNRGVRMVIFFDPSLKWQKLSFDALRVFSRKDGLLEIRP